MELHVASEILSVGSWRRSGTHCSSAVCSMSAVLFGQNTDSLAPQLHDLHIKVASMGGLKTSVMSFSGIMNLCPLKSRSFSALISILSYDCVLF